MQKEYNNQSNCRIHNAEWSIVFQKYTSFSSKSKPKTHKNQNTKSGTGPTWHCADEVADRWFEAELLFAHWIQAVAPLIANLTQAVASLLAKGTCVIPCINPKHQGERQIKSEKG